MKAIYNEKNEVQAFGKNIAPGNDFCEVVNPEICSNDDILFCGCFRYSIVPETGVVTRRTDEQIKATQEYIDKKKAEFDVERFKKIQAVEWMLFTHSTASAACKTAVETYIQTLKDAPDQGGFDPDDFEWPDEPEYVKA